MIEKDFHNEVDDIIIRGIVEHGRKIEQIKKWQRDGHKSVVRRLSYVALVAAAILLLVFVITPAPKDEPLASDKNVAHTQEPPNSIGTDTLSTVLKSKEKDRQLAYTDLKKAEAKGKAIQKADPQANKRLVLAEAGKKVSLKDFPFIVEEEEREGNGASELSIVIDSGLREFGMERLSLEGSNADSLMNHLDLFVDDDDDYDAEWARILILAKVNRKKECLQLLKEFIKKDGPHKEQAIRLNGLLE